MQESLIQKARLRRCEALLGNRRKAMTARMQPEPGIDISNIFVDLDWGIRSPRVGAIRVVHAGMGPLACVSKGA